ncbi:MAG: glutamate--tRNA ligase [Acidimicrobiia bacterium]|nr:glutamate--tRNA ligase [Acidimicrobiia bacterium]
MRLRFAPSPTGFLHVGNARTALFNWLLARGQGGTLVLRIEDTDAGRSTTLADRSVLEDLRWLGLDWDEGVEVGGDRGPYRQSERASTYRAHAQQLLDRGLAYYCFCSAEQLEADREQARLAARPPMYPGRCRRVPDAQARARVTAGEPAVIRFRVPEHRDVVFDDAVRGRVRFGTEVIGDPVLVRSDGMAAYNFAVVVDDALMEISHVVRGEDHLSNTPRQLLLYDAFGWAPPAFAHVSMVLGPDHTKLSKRHGATSVAEFRERGYLPEALANYLALLGWSPGDDEELLPLRELASRFRIEKVGHSAGVFDVEKLAWVNRHYLKAAPPGRLADLAVPFLVRAGWVSGPIGSADRAVVERAVEAAVASVGRLDEVPARLAFLFEYSAEQALGDETIRREAADPAARAVVAALAAVLADAGPLLDRDAFRAAAAQVRERTRQKGRALFHVIRIALTGAASGMELDLAVPLIEQAAGLPGDSGLRRVPGARHRAEAFLGALSSEP